MRATLPFLISLLAVGLVRAQESAPAVSTSRSARQKVSTKPIYEASSVTPSKEPKALNPPVSKAANQLQAVQFVQGKAEFLPGAESAVEQIVAFMRDKPTVEIELAGHTDNQGDFDKNVLLSKQRVELVKEYMVKNGIAANRIATRGYGPTRPIASNNSENTRQLNRRVELSITKQ